MDYLIFKNRTPHEIKPFVGGYNQFFKSRTAFTLYICSIMHTERSQNKMARARRNLASYLHFLCRRWRYSVMPMSDRGAMFYGSTHSKSFVLDFRFFFVAGQSLYAITLLSNLIVSNQSHWLRSRFLVMKWKQAICFILGFIFIMHNWALIQL